MMMCHDVRIICHDIISHMSGEAKNPTKEKGRRGRGGDGQS